MEVRKYLTLVEETAMEGGKKVEPPTRKAAGIAVIKNPFAGKYVENLDELIETGVALGGALTKMAVEALKIPPQKAESYGKAAIVGVDGELEHAAAILHPKLGTPMRDAVGGGKAIIPSAKKRGGREQRSMFPSILRMRRLSGAILMPCRCAFLMRPGRMRSLL